jgi:hypothetical protein
VRADQRVRLRALLSRGHKENSFIFDYFFDKNKQLSKNQPTLTRSSREISSYYEAERKRNMSALANDLNDLNARNAANAQFSTGPTTQIGKDRVKFNALKSGIFARTVVLPGEDQPAYEALGAHLNDQWKPRTDAESEIVLTIQNTSWRLNRIVELEFSAYAIGAQQQLEAMDAQFGEQTPPARFALARAAAYLANPRAFDQISRQEGRLQRALDRAKRELVALLSTRTESPEPAPEPPAETTEAPIAEVISEKPANPSGFVPPKFPRNMPKFSGPQAKEHRRLWLRKHGFSNMA